MKFRDQRQTTTSQQAIAHMARCSFQVPMLFQVRDLSKKEGAGETERLEEAPWVAVPGIVGWIVGRGGFRPARIESGPNQPRPSATYRVGFECFGPLHHSGVRIPFGFLGRGLSSGLSQVPAGENRSRDAGGFEARTRRPGVTWSLFKQVGFRCRVPLNSESMYFL